MKGIYMTDLKTNYYPFWKEGKESISINTSKLINFLNEQGFGNYQTMEGRIQNYTLFYNNNGVLQLHSPNSVKKWLIDYVEKDDKSYIFPNNDRAYRQDYDGKKNLFTFYSKPSEL